MEESFLWLFGRESWGIFGGGLTAVLLETALNQNRPVAIVLLLLL